MDKDFGFFIFGITASIVSGLILFVVSQPDTRECEKKYPHNKIQVIDDKCYYSTKFGWILDGKKVYELKGSRNEKVL